jgi:hypothetical protein
VACAYHTLKREHRYEVVAIGPWSNAGGQKRSPHQSVAGGASYIARLRWPLQRRVARAAITLAVQVNVCPVSSCIDACKKRPRLDGGASLHAAWRRENWGSSRLATDGDRSLQGATPQPNVADAFRLRQLDYGPTARQLLLSLYYHRVRGELRLPNGA